MIEYIDPFLIVVKRDTPIPVRKRLENLAWETTQHNAIWCDINFIKNIPGVDPTFCKHPDWFVMRLSNKAAKQQVGLIEGFFAGLDYKN